MRDFTLRLLGILLVVAFVLVGPSVALAHTVTTSGSEGEGWINQKAHYHHPTTSAYFDWRPHYSLPSAWVDHMRSADSRWNNAQGSPVYCFRYDSSTNYIKDAQLGGPEARLLWTSEVGSNNQDYYSFDIVIDCDACTSYTTERKIGICVHELGHAIGLKDLFDSNNTDQVMYGSSASRATYPYSDIPHKHGDVYGATVIW